MRNRNTQGFTLIELLIVIAIIGILAAVLIPNLLSARTTATDRAAESYARNVYTAAFAYLSEDIAATADDITEADCAAGYTSAAGYEVKDPGSAVATCTVTNDAGAGGGGTDFTVDVTSGSSNNTPYSFP